jgi:hypothetical protein
MARRNAVSAGGADPLAGLDMAAIATRVRSLPPLSISLTAERVLQLVGTIQLALRHERFRSTDVAIDMALFATSLERELVRREPELAPVLAAGWDASQDA